MGPGVSAHRQRFAATFVLPPEVAARVPERSGADDVGPALRGLRQWMRIRILTDKPMGMPSLGTQIALDEFLALDAANAFRRDVYGRHAPGRLADAVAAPEAANETMALTWAMACNDQRPATDAPETLPALFAADVALGLHDGWKWVIFCGHEPCATPDFCVRHDLLSHLPEKIPHQVLFDQPRPHSLLDKGDEVFTPGHSSFPSNLSGPC